LREYREAGGERGGEVGAGESGARERIQGRGEVGQ
jgi:hypothetical protein